MSTQSEDQITLVGCGNMGSALLAGWVSAGLSTDHITVIDPGSPSLPAGVAHLRRLETLSSSPRVVLAVKPQSLQAVAPTLAALVSEKTIVASILAGIEIATLRRYAPTARAVVRGVCNLPAAIGRGVTSLVSDSSNPAVREAVEVLFRPLGALEWLEDEHFCNAATALTGCSPAFLFRFVDAMIDTGTRAGFDYDQSRRLVLQTLGGSIELLSRSDDTPSTWTKRVASPGGMTLAGLSVLDRNDSFMGLVSEGLSTAIARGEEIAKQSR